MAALFPSIFIISAALDGEFTQRASLYRSAFALCVSMRSISICKFLYFLRNERHIAYCTSPTAAQTGRHLLIQRQCNGPSPMPLLPLFFICCSVWTEIPCYCQLCVFQAASPLLKTLYLFPFQHELQLSQCFRLPPKTIPDSQTSVTSLI